jgi:hypothetical protein
VKLIFFDEAKNDPKYPHYHLGGVCIDEADLGPVEERINQLSDEVFGTRALTRETEFHAWEIFHKARHFSQWTDFNRRIDLLGRFIDILSLPQVKRIDIQINCGSLYAPDRADEFAFMYFCERANTLVKSDRSLGMLIGDRESDHLAARYSTTLSGYRAQGTEYDYGRDIKNLVDSVHFTHSHLSRFLQLADVYVWLLQFFVRNRSSENFRHRAVFDLLRRPGVNLYPHTYKVWPNAQ